MFEATIGGWNKVGGWCGGTGDGEAVEIHLGSEALGEIVGRDPSCERDKAICHMISHITFSCEVR